MAINNKTKSKIEISRDLSKIVNPGGGNLDLMSTRDMITYDGENYATGPYYDCRDSCANYPAGGEPEWCLEDVGPCDFFVFVSDVWNRNEINTGAMANGQFSFQLSIMPTTRDVEVGDIGSIGKFNFAMDFCSEQPLVGLGSGVTNDGLVGHIENDTWYMMENNTGGQSCFVPGDSALGLECDDFPGHMSVQTMRVTADWLNENQYYLKHQNYDAESVRNPNINNTLNMNDLACVSSVITGVSTAAGGVTIPTHDYGFPNEAMNLVSVTVRHANPDGSSAYDTILAPGGDPAPWMGPEHCYGDSPCSCSEADCEGEDWDLDGEVGPCYDPLCITYDEDECVLSDTCNWSSGTCYASYYDICPIWTSEGMYGGEFAIGGARGKDEACSWDNFPWTALSGNLADECWGYSSLIDPQTCCGAGGDQPAHDHEAIDWCRADNKCQDENQSLTGYACGGIVESTNELFCRDKYLAEYDAFGNILGYLDPVRNWSYANVAAYYNCQNGNHECLSSEWEQECDWCQGMWFGTQGDSSAGGSAGYPKTVPAGTGVTFQGGIGGSIISDCNAGGCRILKIDIARSFYCHPDHWDEPEGDADVMGCVSRIFHHVGDDNEAMTANFAFIPAYVHLDKLLNSELVPWALDGLTGVPKASNSYLGHIDNFWLENLFGCNNWDACTDITPYNTGMAGFPLNPWAVENPDLDCAMDNAVTYYLDDDNDGYKDSETALPSVCLESDYTLSDTCAISPWSSYYTSTCQYLDVDPDVACEYNNFGDCTCCVQGGLDENSTCTNYGSWSLALCPHLDCKGSSNGGCWDCASTAPADGGWDDCGDCYGGNAAKLGCGCDYPAPVYYVRDMDDDTYYDNPVNSCGYLCVTGSCDGTVSGCHNTIAAMEAAEGYDCVQASTNTMEPSAGHNTCAGCLDVCGVCWTGGGCGDGNDNCTASCTGSSYQEGLEYCGGTVGSCCDCDGTIGGSAGFDECGVCGGNDKSCCNGAGTAYDGQCTCDDGYCPNGAIWGDACDTPETDSDSTCGGCGTSWKLSPTGDTCCSSGTTTGEEYWDCAGDCNGTKNWDCCGVCSNSPGDTCRDYCGDEGTCTNVNDPVTTWNESSSCSGPGPSNCHDFCRPGSTTGTNACQQNSCYNQSSGSSPGGYKKTEVNQRFHPVTFVGAQPWYTGGSCTGLWLNILDEVPPSQAEAKCANDSTSSAPSGTSCDTPGSAMGGVSDWNDGVDWWGGNVCGQTPPVNLGSGCKSCGVCCGGFGPTSLPWDGHGCGVSTSAGCSGMFSFGGGVYEDPNNFNIS